MSVEFCAAGGGVAADVETLAAVALDGVLTEVRADRDSSDLRRLSSDVGGVRAVPVMLDSDGVLAWLRALTAVRAHLASTLAVDDLERAEVVSLTGQLAADSPVQTAARAFLWVGALLEDLCAAARQAGVTSA